MFPVCASVCFLVPSAAEAPERYDLVLHGGRVMDVRDVARFLEEGRGRSRSAPVP
jgi:hypothetical protein